MWESFNFLSVGVLVTAVSALFATLVTIWVSWFSRRTSQTFKLQVGDKTLQVQLGELEKTLKEIEDNLQELREKPSVFLSYSSKDKDFANRLVEGLRSEGLKVWTADEQIKVGDSLKSSVSQAISKSQWVIVILSENSSRSGWVSKELSLALEAEKARGRTLVLPVVYQGAVVPPEINEKVFADFRSSYETGFKSLLSSIRRGALHPITSS
jgi:hypothetical protein